jgi:hydrogenase expression/formation protein HypE
MSESNFEAFACPAPARHDDTIVMAHGGGGRMTAHLLSSVFLPVFANDVLLAMEDQATVEVGNARVAITTDAFVVRPIFFPGGDIGRLAVSGTVNDLVVGGARPLFLTAAFVLEEGLAIEDLRRVVESMQRACQEAGITLVAGDTKVVDRGKGDAIYISTTGVGVVPASRAGLSASAARPGDVVIVSGTLGDHGIAVLAQRDGLEVETDLRSDVAPLGALVERLLSGEPRVRCMRDPTRGGLATTVIEIAARSNVGMVLDEEALPVRPEVRSICELLGLDPVYVANEGKLVAIVDPADAPEALAALRSHPLGRDAAVVGRVTDEHPRVVRLRTRVGGERVVPLLSGEQLPRIC